MYYKEIIHIFVKLHANKKTINFIHSEAEQSCYQPLTRNQGSKSPGNFRLDSLSRNELRNCFEQAGLGHIPKNASQGFLKGHLAWAKQAVEAGFDPVTLRKNLVRKARRAKRPTTPIYKPGTRLIREWQGVTHEVTIEEKGFVWNGERYRSLSRIAHDITGTKWSGPRFFGLNEVKHHA